jgi:hypothetical protein
MNSTFLSALLLFAVACNAVARPDGAQTIATLKIPEGGFYPWYCLDGPCKINGLGPIELENTDSAYLHLQGTNNLYFFYEGAYALDFRCPLYEEGEETDAEYYRVWAFLEGGKQYELSLPLGERSCPPEIVEAD